MVIREASYRDIPALIDPDIKSYGKFGADKNYFLQKFQSKFIKILVMESDQKITGFIVFEVMDSDKQLTDFCDLHINDPIKGSWMHIIALTTVSNYSDFLSNTKFLKAAEDKATTLGCNTYSVSLSINHPYPQGLRIF